MECLLECFECQIPCVKAFVMSFKSGTSLVLLAACLTALTALPANAATSSAAARQNVIQGERYYRLLEANGSFRQARMRRECGPITDPQLRQSCLDSFSQYEPASAHATSTRKVARRNQLDIRPTMSARRRYRGSIKAEPDSSRWALQ
jgi:hypothetical protein